MNMREIIITLLPLIIPCIIFFNFSEFYEITNLKFTIKEKIFYLGFLNIILLGLIFLAIFLL